MSRREQVQQQILTHLEEHAQTWNAPYGILSGLESVGRGKVRTITFGQARNLDAVIRIWTPTRIEVEGHGPLAYAVQGRFNSPEDFITHIALVEVQT